MTNVNNGHRLEPLASLNAYQCEGCGGVFSWATVDHGAVTACDFRPASIFYYDVRPRATQALGPPLAPAVCECGSAKLGSPNHSDWCPVR